MTLIPPIKLPSDTTLPTIVDGVADGYEAFALAALAAELGERPLIFVARDGQRLPALAEILAFVAPGLPVLELPAWDCLPYDRVSPGADAAARRLDAMAAMAALAQKPHRAVVLVSANAALQRMPAAGAIAAQTLFARPGNQLDMRDLTARLETSGFERVPTVRDVGEYAVRGGILDLFAPGGEPLRLDFFGDTLESIRAFDVATQRTIGQRKDFAMKPMSEVTLTQDSISRFRRSYIEAFGAPARDDALYAAISEGRRFAGMEHWLPLFYERLETVFDYLPDSPVVFDHLSREAMAERHALILDHYAARAGQPASGLAESVPYKPVKPDALYLTPDEVTVRAAERRTVEFSAFDAPDTSGRVLRHAGAHAGHRFTEERADPGANVFDHVVTHIAERRAAGKRVLLAGWSEGSLDRLAQILEEHGLGGLARVATLDEAEALPAGQAGLAVLPLETGFETARLVVVGEQDILGDRLVRRSKKRRKAADFIAEAAALSAGDIVVHADHGIGRFVGLRTIEAAGAPHDCLEIRYAGDDRLFLPVENIELLSRYGSDTAEAALDKLGGGAWQARKARLKKRLLEMAGQLIKLAAERQMRPAPVLLPPEGLYGEFAARFPYDETDDQQAAIDAVAEGLSAGRPMDRLICGDVGFGKTEVALRAAFVVAMSGAQVAVVVPTTLLARQHSRIFTARFQGFPVKVAQLSRMVTPKEAAAVKEGLKSGEINIVVGTHALLAKGVAFSDLGLVVVDEEQHFGVKHKEALKSLKADVHVLTLTATPIPRTLQLALTGVREMSVIATPPVDRLAVRTFIMPWDPVVLREAIQRERFRGGQVFCVVPRIEDMAKVAERLAEIVPEARVIQAHGRLSPTELERVMTEFGDGKHDVLLSTNIVESGLDMPAVNTLLIHRADMFGLAQLYQLRGRVGRGKLRGYAYLTWPQSHRLSGAAEKRLEVMQTLDNLGAGFTLASHDLDIRGAGNLLGEEQSGQIREVGIELYQQMLEEAVADIKAGQGRGEESERDWTPQINLGLPVLIPEDYVADLPVRLGLYRRIGGLATDGENDAMAAELVDRFGPLPLEVENLLQVVAIKRLCREAGVEKLDAGPKGIVLSFRGNRFANPAGLVAWVQARKDQVKLRPDHKLALLREMDLMQRVKAARDLLASLAKVARQARAA